MIYRLLADALVVGHLGFVFFVVAGALPALRWPRVAWIHLPCAIWGAGIELVGGVCPLTPLENRLRAAAGQNGYEGGFVEHYLLPILYPGGLTREIQVLLGVAVVLINVVVYGWLLLRRRRASLC